MAFQKITVDKDEWVLIGDNVVDITFQNVDQWPVFINFNDSSTPPEEEMGLVYGPYSGELKRTVEDLTYKTSPNFVFAKAVSRPVTITYETL
jgi:hypothetical protein